jgi:hypothetical protein
MDDHPNISKQNFILVFLSNLDEIFNKSAFRVSDEMLTPADSTNESIVATRLSAL